MAALGALGVLGGTLREMAMAPVRRWVQTSTTHKIIAAGTGAGLAYYLHKKGMSDVAVALLGVGGAYATSALMHSPQVVSTGANGTSLPGAPVAGALPPGQVQNMAEQAVAAMNNGSNGMSGSKWGAIAAQPLAPVASVGSPSQTTQRPVVGAPSEPVGADPSGGGSGTSKWALLG